MSSDLRDIFGEGFDPSQYEPAKDYQVVPPGKYLVTIEEAEVKMTKAQDGHYIKIKAVVQDGEYKGCPIYANINIDNPDPKCVQIGIGQLTALTVALGITKFKDTAQLVNGAVIAHVKVKEGTGNYGPQNNIRTYSSVKQRSAASPAAQQTATKGPLPNPPPPVTSGETLPWQQ